MILRTLFLTTASLCITSVLGYGKNTLAFTGSSNKIANRTASFSYGDATQYEYETKFISMPVDHFSFANPDKFELRYLINDQHWGGEGAPIFFYTGNEGDITWFCNNTGFVWEIAVEFHAMIVFAEHRYYGESKPYGKDSFKDPRHSGYLTSEQALADFADLIRFLKANISGAANSPVVAFGGSYGGMLAAWFRIKYPHVVVGSLAASAPIWQFTGLTPCQSYNQIVTNDFHSASSACVTNINNTWSVINTLAASASGRETLYKSLRLCAPLKSESEAEQLKDWLIGIYGNLAMVDYPYGASFLEPLPAWPVKAFCKPLSEVASGDVDLLERLADGINVYFNHTGAAMCFNHSQEAVASMDDSGWDYQACTEMVMPMCANGVTDMFEPSPWNMSDYVEGCRHRWQVEPRSVWMEVQYGGKDITAASNIIFSNGKLDPWSAGGVLESLSESLVAIIIDEGAHHLDLRSSNPQDPPSVVRARDQERRIIRRWILEYNKELDEESRYYLFGLNFGLNVDIQYPPETKSYNIRSTLVVLMEVILTSCLIAVIINSLRVHWVKRYYRRQVPISLSPDEVTLLKACEEMEKDTKG